MTDRFADFMTQFFLKRGLIGEEEKAIYRIGFDVIFGTCVSYTVILTVGILLQDMMGAALFLICFSTVRNYCGGYHAKTRARCLFTMLMAFMLVEILSNSVATGSEGWRYVCATASIAFACVLAVCVPVADRTKEYHPDDVRKNRKKALRIIVFWYLILCVMIKNSLSVKIEMTMNIVAVMILMTRPWRMETKNCNFKNRETEDKAV